MEEIGKHISELLFDHDCVIVPTLGGFLASNQSARVLVPNQIIFPPYRRIAFNVYLKQNDGLLANHMVKSENIPYSEATQRIKSFTTSCFDSLDNGKKINIAEVGSLVYDKEKNIQFEAFRNINHLKDSFGMEPVHFLPINRDESIEKKKLPIEKAMRPSIPSENKKETKINWSTRKKVIGAAVIVSGLVWFSLNLYMVAPKHYESTSLNPFDSQNIVINKTDSLRNIPSENSVITTTENVETLKVASVPVEEITASANNNSEINNAKINETNLSNVTSKGNSTEVKNSLPAVQKEPDISPYTGSKNYLIAGVFKIKENAQSMHLHLQQLGFSNARIIEANNRSYVSYEEFIRPNDALVLADSLHRKNLEGWIWKH